MYNCKQTTNTTKNKNKNLPSLSIIINLHKRGTVYTSSEYSIFHMRCCHYVRLISLEFNVNHIQSYCFKVNCTRYHPAREL
jgi:hypothetical protein